MNRLNSLANALFSLPGATEKTENTNNLPPNTRVEHQYQVTHDKQTPEQPGDHHVSRQSTLCHGVPTPTSSMLNKDGSNASTSLAELMTDIQDSEADIEHAGSTPHSPSAQYDLQAAYALSNPDSDEGFHHECYAELDAGLQNAKEASGAVDDLETPEGMAEEDSTQLFISEIIRLEKIAEDLTEQLARIQQRFEIQKAQRRVLEEEKAELRALCEAASRRVSCELRCMEAFMVLVLFVRLFGA